ncbi:MAG: alkaline phosphatase PhoX [Pseudomonadota bacterium]
MMRTISRREFSRLMSSAAAASVVAPLGLLNARVALANGPGGTASFSVPGFGPISPVVPNNTAELTSVAGAGDLSGVPLLQLPAGFQYTAISIRGDRMSDGNLVPGDHDGMAAFYAGRGQYALVRNHELSIIESEAGDITGCLAANGKQYDPFQNEAAGLGGGGTSTVIVDLEGRVVQDYVSLGGTIRNCAGGPTPWGSWISCEENVTTPASDGRAMMKHGYNFEVPFALGEAVDPIPLVDMGRMNHEAVSVDETTGYIYETEDRGDSAYYRFVPKVRGIRGFGALQEGGDLYAMRIKPGQRSLRDGSPLPTTFANGTEVVDTRGTGRGAPASFLPFLGQPLAVEWVRLEDVDPEGDTLRAEAQAKGASIFWRGEGAWQFQGKHYWVNSGAGDAREGQVMVYDPATETVTLIVESTDENLLDGPDNITVGRDGTLYLCEDGSSGTPGAPNFSQRVVGVDATGGLFTFAQNNIDTSEFCGACLDPVGRRMFVNLQGIGITFAIWRSDNAPITLGAPFGQRPSSAPAGRGHQR